MLITLDTNVLFQALRGRSGASYAILQNVRMQLVQIALSVPVFIEYQAVLGRSKSLAEFGLSAAEVDALLRFIAFVGKPYETWFRLRPNLADEDDNIFVELAVASGSECLVTNNIKDFENSELRFDSLDVLTPAVFMRKWRARHG